MRTKFVSTLPALLLALAAVVLAVIGLIRYNQEKAVAPVSDQGGSLTEAPAKSKEPEAPVYTYLFAREDISAGTELTPELFSQIESPVQLQGMITADEAPFGDKNTATIPAGNPLSQSSLENASPLQLVVKDGIRAMAFELSPLSSVGGLLRPGDVVDVIATFRGGNQQEAASTILLRDVEVLAVRGATEQSGAEDDDDNRRNATMVLAVPQQDVNRLALASSEASLKFVATSRGIAVDQATDDESAGERPETLSEEPEVVLVTDIRPETSRKPAPQPRAEQKPQEDPGHKVQMFEGSESRTVYVR